MCGSLWSQFAVPANSAVLRCPTISLESSFNSPVQMWLCMFFLKLLCCICFMSLIMQLAELKKTLTQIGLSFP